MDCYRRLRKVIWRSARRPVCFEANFLPSFGSDAEDVAKAEVAEMDLERFIGKISGRVRCFSDTGIRGIEFE